MADFKIGTEFADGKFYAGPNYGFVEKQEYEELDKNGNLQVGQQFYDRGVKNLTNRFSNTYNLLPEDVRNTINSNGKGLLATAAQIASDAWAVQDPEHKKHAEIGANIVQKTVDLPAEIIHQSSKPFTDGRGVSKDLINVGEIVIPITGGLLKNVAKKGGPRLLQKIDDVSDAFRSSKQFAGATIGQVPTNGRIKVPTNGNGGNGVNGVHKPLQITVDPKHRVIDSGFTQKTSNQEWLHDLSKKVKSTNKDKVNRAWATPPSAVDNSPIMYSKQTFKNPLYKQHHLDPKAEDAVFKKLMLEFGDKEDLVNMHAVANTKGVGGGDRMSNLLYMLDEAHTQGEGALHPWRRTQESILGLTMEPGPKKLEEALRKASGGDPNKLMDLYKQYIQVNFIPSRNQAFKLQSKFAKEIGENIKSRPNLQLLINKKKPTTQRIKTPLTEDEVQALYESVPSHFGESSLRL